MIKGPLGLIIWADTLGDPTAVTPFDLIAADQEQQARIKAEAEPTNNQVIDCTHELIELIEEAA